MMEDDLPAPKPKRVTAHALHAWSVTELQDYIAELRGEIARAEASIDHKQGHRQAAEAFFRLPVGPSE